MPKKLPYTPNSRIRQALRRLFLRSRERASALKRDGYSCVKCGIKQTKKKGQEVYVECHHKEGIDNWSELISSVRKYLLCDIEYLETLCENCHKKETESNNNGKE